MKKKDWILAGSICVLAVIAWLAVQFLLPKEHHTVRITVDGELFGEYSLEEDQTISIGETNVCRITAGKAEMIQADCPDQLCVHQKAVDGAGGTIICLPNRIVVEAVAKSSDAETKGGLDAVV